MIAQSPCALIEVAVIRRHHTAFTGRDDLVAVEAEHAASAEASDAAPPVLRAMGFGRILDDGHAMRVGNFAQRIHIRRVPVKMHRHDRLGSWRQQRFHRCGIEAKRVRVDVG